MLYALALAAFEVVHNRTFSGSIYIDARPSVTPALPHVSSTAIRLLHEIERLRYAVIGHPCLASRRVAKTLLRPVRH